MKEEADYKPPLTITGISDELCEYLEKIGIARKIYPQIRETRDELDRQVETDEI